MRRGGAGGLPGRGSHPRRDGLPAGRPAEAVPLLVRLRPEAGGGGGVSVRPGPLSPRAGLSPRICCPGVQDHPGRPGQPPDLDEDHRGQLKSQDPLVRRGGGGPLGGEGRPAAPLLRGQVPQPGPGGGGQRGGRHRSDPHPPRPGPGGPGGGGAPGLRARPDL